MKLLLGENFSGVGQMDDRAGGTNSIMTPASKVFRSLIVMKAERFWAVLSNIIIVFEGIYV